jgi:hypothetical protein
MKRKGNKFKALYIKRGSIYLKNEQFVRLNDRLFIVPSKEGMNIITAGCLFDGW